MTGAEQVIHLAHADRVEYFERDQLAILTGNVRVGLEDSAIAADTIRFDQARGLITAEGHLTWVSGTLTATGSRMTYQLQKREGVVEDVSLMAGLWLCRGERVVQRTAGEIDVTPGVITTCDLASPHYSIRCKSIHIRLSKDLVATSVTVLVGRTPVLWLPYLVTPLREFRLPFEAQVGHTGPLGVFLRTSPAYALGGSAPGQAHLDYFEHKGWGYGVTQELLDGKGTRSARVHAYRIDERTSSGPGVPRSRWELFAEGAHDWGSGGRFAGHADVVSDAHVRESYGYRSLPVPLVAGERRASALLSQGLGWGDASLLAERAETQRLTGFSLTSSGRYAVSTVRAPRMSVTTHAWPLTSWLSASARGEAGRAYDWLTAGDDPSWYVTRAGVAPALEAFGRIPGAGQVTVTDRLTADWRDRGDRVLLASSTTFIEDANRGPVFRDDLSSSLRRSLPLGLEAELSHLVARRLNKIGYDPYGYRGLELHQALARLDVPLGPAGSANARGGFDLRDIQDPVRRRWLPLSAAFSGAPRGGASLGAEGEFDLWYGAWRRVSGSAAYRGAGGVAVSVRPSYTDNRLGLPLATTTSPEYRVSTLLYGSSFQSAAVYPRIVLVDLTASAPVGPGFRATLTGQLDALPPADAYLPPAARGPVQRHVRFYTLTITRDLHCWELAGTFERYASGEVRFNASLNLKAFPTERFPLVSL